ncbi:MAG: hypothetical protein ACK4SO_06565 [Candidatus Kapaibacteriota bacterium]
MLTFKLFKFFLFIPFLWNFSYSQVKITIPQTFINRGQFDTIVVFGDFSDLNFTKLDLVFQFNAVLIDLIKIVSDSEYLIAEPEPSFNVSLNNLSDAILRISSSSINNSLKKESILCKIIAEGLVYKDSVDTIKLLQVQLDDTPVDFLFNGGIIIVKGPLVFPVKNNYLSEGFPTPTSERVQFRFGIVKSSFVDILVFNSKGETVLTSVQAEEYFKVLGKNREISLNEKLEDGDYLLELTLPYDFPSGVYFLELNAYSIGSFRSKFLIVK